MSSKPDSSNAAARSSGPESFAVGYLWSFGATALPLVSAFLASLIIARWMGPEAVGLISLTQAFATALLIFGKFGIEGAASRLASEYQVSAPWRIPRLIRFSVLMRLAFTLPTAAAATLFAPHLARLFGNAMLLPLFRLSGLLIIAVSINEYSALVALGLKRFRLLFSMRAVMLLLKVLLVLAAALASWGVVSLLGAYVAAALLPGLAVLMILLMIRAGKGPDAEAEPMKRRLLALSVSLAVSGASVTIYSLLDKLMLGYFSTVAQVGLYTMARNIVETSLFPTFALVMTLRPALAAAYTADDRARCSNLVYRSIRYSFLYASGVVVALACLARPVVVGLYTDRFIASADLLTLFLPIIIMRSIGSVILPGLIAADRAGTYARLTLAGALLNFLLNGILIPGFGATGAVIATLASYLPIDVFGIREVNRAFGGLWRAGDGSRIARVVLASGLIIALYAAFAPAPVGLARTVIYACIVLALYIALLLALRVLSIGELRDYAASVRSGASRR